MTKLDHDPLWISNQLNPPINYCGCVYQHRQKDADIVVKERCLKSKSSRFHNCDRCNLWLASTTCHCAICEFEQIKNCEDLQQLEEYQTVTQPEIMLNKVVDYESFDGNGIIDSRDSSRLFHRNNMGR